MNTSGVTLRLLDKEILKLPRTVKGALFDFQHKSKTNLRTTGLKLQQLKGDSRLWSARVNDEYRALLLRLADDDWLRQPAGHAFPDWSSEREGIAALIRSDGPHGDGGVHIGTMFRFEGLEYQRMIIAGAADGLAPRDSVNGLRETDPGRHRHEMQRARSLLFVAATRARDSVDVFWHGRPSPFISASLTGKADGLD